MTAQEYNNCVEKYADDIYRFVLHNVRDEDSAKDIVQDTFEKVWVNASNVNYAKAKSYLFTTAYHRIIDKARKDKRQTSFDEVNFNQHSHEEQYSDLSEVLRDAIAKLPEIQRSVLMLRDYEGYNYAEIGDICKLSESQVKVYIYRARMFLKSYLVNIHNVI